MSYVHEVINDVVEKNPSEPEFHQAVKEVLLTIEPVLKKHPEYRKVKILERIVEPERQIIFRVPWIDDRGEVQINKGYRVGFNSAIGPYKGGLRLHRSVNLSIVKFLGFEQIFKNSLTGFPIGAGKGGSDFDPENKSDTEVMKFCQSFMTELYRHIGADTDVPAGDLGTGTREIGYLFGQYKRIKNVCEGVLTGKGLSYGGSLGRKEATGYGLVYFMEMLLKDYEKSIEGSRVVVSGAGNVALYAMEKVRQMGGTVVAVSDDSGMVYNPAGVDIDAIKKAKEFERIKISDYAASMKQGEFFSDYRELWKVPCDIALPCATQNEMDEESAKALVSSGCKAVGEGANMPCTPEAIRILQENGLLFAPSKAANAGGVATSALEMAQNSMRYSWTFDEVDNRLKKIMSNIYRNAKEAAVYYDKPNNLIAGANIAGFVKVAEAMLAQGVV
ncbi:MAG: NADP-specific glutamate dehydrogenase [Clostridia bacterium]|nr:NADP-specific glutamate dehydrogenase [Clostridia bacterium]